AGSISSLSSSAMFDLYKSISKKDPDAVRELRISRLFTIVAAAILTLVAFIFIQMSQSVVEIALGIASITYGGLLGTFLLGLFFKKVTQKGAVIGFSVGIIAMLSVSLPPVIFDTTPLVHWTWYVALGTVVTLISGSLFREKAVK
ncbi:MAG TPA: sodium:solute symporter, partial [Caldithrix abyssi]|nr:sodium:solute symporter [Caldithrix abyssi]